MIDGSTHGEKRAGLGLGLAGIVLAVLALSAFLGRRASPRYLVLLVGAAAAAIFWIVPPLGLVALVAANLLVRYSIGTGTQTAINVAMLMVALLFGLWVVRMIGRREWSMPLSPVTRPLVLLGVAAVISFIVGQLPWVMLPHAPLRSQIGGLAMFWLSIAAFLLAANQLQDMRWLARLVWVFLALTSVYLLSPLAGSLANRILPLFQTKSSPSLYWTWLVAMALSQALFNKRLRTRWRVALAFVAVYALYLGFFQGRSWVAGYLPSMVAAAAIVWARWPRLGIVMAVLLPAVVILNEERVMSAVMVGGQYGQEWSLITRLEAWRIVSDMTLHTNPITGLGPANYWWFTTQYSMMGWYVNFNSHSQWVDLFAQTGIVGLACFGLFAWQLARLSLRLRSRVPEGFERAYVYGVIGGLAGTLVAGVLADYIIPFVYNLGFINFRSSVLFWLFAGGLVAIDSRYGHAES